MTGVHRSGTLALALSICAAACGGSAPTAGAKPVFELRAVAKPRLAEATARAPVVTLPAHPADPEAVEAVLGTLASPESRLRALALADAKALDDGGVAALGAALSDDAAEPARRTAAAEALGAIATPLAVDALATRLEVDRAPWLRAQCAWQLRVAGLDEVVPRLVLRLKYETDGPTVVWIADALASFGSLAGLDGLRVLSGAAQDDGIRRQAADLLEALAAERGFADGAALHRAWSQGDPEGRIPLRQPGDALRREAWDRIVRLGEWDLRRVDDARFVLVRLEAWITPMLAEALHDADVYTRVHAGQCLERRGPRARAAVTELLAALGEPRLSAQAATALGAIGDPAARSALEESIGPAHPLESRIAAARALANVGGDSSLPPLRAAWSASEPIDLRQAAAGTLAALGDDAGVAPFLLECLVAPTGTDVGAAEHALGAWIATRSARDAAWQELRARWDALEPAAGSVPDAARVAERRGHRAALAREAITRSAR